MNKYEKTFIDFRDFIIKLELIYKPCSIGATREEIRKLETNLNIELDPSLFSYLSIFGGEFRKQFKSSNTDFLVPSIKSIQNAHKNAFKKKMFKHDESIVLKNVDSWVPIQLESNLKNILFIYNIQYSGAYSFVELKQENPIIFVVFESLNSIDFDVLSNGVRISILPFHYFFMSIYYYKMNGDKSMLDSQRISDIPWLKAYDFLSNAYKNKQNVLKWRCEYYIKIEQMNHTPTIDEIEYGFIKYMIEEKKMSSILESFNPYEEFRTHNEYLR